MADNFDQSIEVLQFVSKILGSTLPVKINSNILNHSNYREKPYTKDIFQIDASESDPITLDKILNTFKLMNKHMKNKEYGRSYFYEGLEFSSKLQLWEVCWGS